MFKMLNVLTMRSIGKIFCYVLLCCVATPAFSYTNDHLMYGIYWGTIIVQDVSIGLGLCFFLSGLFRFKKYAEQRSMMSHQGGMGKAMAMLLSGVALLSTPVTVNTLLRAFWGSASPLAYPILSDSNATEAIQVVIALIRFVGLLGVIRGIVLFSRVGGEQSQPGTAGKAVLHITGGLLCLHIMNVYYIICYLLDFDSYV